MIRTHLLYYDIVDSDWQPERHLTPLGWLVGLAAGLAFYLIVCYAVAFFSK